MKSNHHFLRQLSCPPVHAALQLSESRLLFLGCSKAMIDLSLIEPEKERAEFPSARQSFPVVILHSVINNVWLFGQKAL